MIKSSYWKIFYFCANAGKKKLIDRFVSYINENANCVVYNEQPIYLYDDCNVCYDEKPFLISACEVFVDMPRIVDNINELKERLEIAAETIRKKIPPSVEEAVCDFRSGCQEAFDYVFKFFRPKMEFMAYDKCKNSDADAEDVIGEIFMQFIKCMRTYKFGPIKFNTFFWRCAQNTVGMFFTKKSAKKRNDGTIKLSLHNSLDEEGKSDMIEMIVDKSSEEDMHMVLIKKMLQDMIFPYIEDKDRKMLSLYAQGYDITEISRRLRLTKSGIYLRLRNLRENTNVQPHLHTLRRALLCG